MTRLKSTRKVVRRTRRQSRQNQSRHGGGKGGKSKTQRVSNTRLRSRSVPRYIDIPIRSKRDIEAVAPGYSPNAYSAAWQKIRSGSLYATSGAVILWLASLASSYGGVARSVAGY
jgi:hypothetical protein